MTYDVTETELGLLLQSVTKHFGQSMKTMYKSNLFTPRTPLSMLRRNVWAKNIVY